MRLSPRWLIVFCCFSLQAFAQSRPHTTSQRVKIMDTAFSMTELGRSRKIWIYQPEGKKGEKFPVLYMQDGQNLFDDQTSYAGEWGLDEFMDTTSLPKCIIVGIDNGGVHRIQEYAPYDMAKYGKAEGESYLRFLVNQLKPFIDGHYPVLSDRKDTWIGGSSLGGLISFYALLKYPDTFGGAAVFSPSFWIAAPVYKEAEANLNKINASIYFYVGKKEGDEMVPDMLKMAELVAKGSHISSVSVVREEGKHNEGTWRQEFPLFYRWLIENRR